MTRNSGPQAFSLRAPASSLFLMQPPQLLCFSRLWVRLKQGSLPDRYSFDYNLFFHEALAFLWRSDQKKHRASFFVIVSFIISYKTTMFHRKWTFSFSSITLVILLHSQSSFFKIAIMNAPVAPGAVEVAGPPTDGVLGPHGNPKLSNHEAYNVIGVNSMLLVLCFMAVAGRLKARRMTKARLSFDDYLALVALVSIKRPVRDYFYPLTSS